jgi:hypothetical protein
MDTYLLYLRGYVILGLAPVEVLLGTGFTSLGALTAGWPLPLAELSVFEVPAASEPAPEV